VAVVEVTTHKKDEPMGGIKELAAAVGREGKLRTAEGLRVDVTVEDARRVYGRVDFRVSPLAGACSAWVGADRVEIKEGT
jgi:hypothetical protein